MYSIATRILGAAALLAGVSSAQNFRIVATHYTGTPGETLEWRVWSGDGVLFVGPNTPGGVEKAVNITIPDWSGSAPKVVIAPEEPEAPEDIPEGSFLVVDNTEGVDGPIFDWTDESTLPEECIYEWVRWGTIMLPKGASEPNYYLVPTKAQDTWAIIWRRPGTPGDGLRAVNLTAIL